LSTGTRSLTFRLVTWYCGLLLVIGGSFALYTYFGFTFYLKTTMRATLQTRVNDLEGIADPLLNDLPALGRAIEQRFAPAAHDRFMRVTLNGVVIYRSSFPVDRAFDPANIQSDLGTKLSLRDMSGLWVLQAATHRADGSWVVFEAGQLDEAMASARRGLIQTLLFTLPLLLFVAALGGYRLIRRAQGPMTAMINAAEALTFNSPHKRLPLAGPDDPLNELGRTLNRMLERLDVAYEHANRFSADAAHELRTPLAIMRGELEFIAPRPELTPEVADAAANALDETLRLSQLVENLMNLGVMDGIGGKQSHTPIDLGGLATETIEQMMLLADVKKIDLHLTPGLPVSTMGDRGRLKQVLVNLIGNAIKYTPTAGRVALNVFAQEGHAIINVVDNGIGISPEDQNSIFDRFFRVAPDRGPDGAGLGLAMVKSICLAHGGSVSVQSVPGAGSTFSVRLPLAPISPLTRHV